MSHTSFTPEERFAMIVEELRSLPDVTPPSDGPQPQKGFGALALKVQNKIFAMLVEGKLVVRSPSNQSWKRDGSIWREKRWSLWPHNGEPEEREERRAWSGHDIMNVMVQPHM